MELHKLLKKQIEKHLGTDELSGNLQDFIYSVNSAYFAYEDDMTLRKQMEVQLKFIDIHDPLTGLYNRAYFEEEMKRLNGKPHDPVGIIIFDIDGLKLVNDTFSHEQGDLLLQTTARISKGCFRESDVVARIGGDEFAVLLPACSREKLENACLRLRNTVEQYNSQLTQGINKIPLSISIGFAISSRLSLPDLYKEAYNDMNREKLHHRQSTRSTIVATLIRALEARDFTTEWHANRMRELVKKLGEAVALPERNIADLVLLAQFHDIGKVGIPDRILFKPGRLTSEETAEMRRHCEIGRRIAQSSPDLMIIADWILKHHEWWNGNGYPLGLKGEAIPLECRILAIVDAYDAITSDRPYRKALSHEKAAAELRRCAGTQFDPELINIFLPLIESKEKCSAKPS